MKTKTAPKTYAVGVQYRCAGNYKYHVTLILPPKYLKKNGVPKEGDELTMQDFGLTPEDAYNLLNVKYDSELDHNILEVLEVREEPNVIF